MNQDSKYDILNDNDLFNTIKGGLSVIEPTMEDWIEIYKSNNNEEEEDESKGEALAVLINCILRCCSCNHSINKFEALDLDAVASNLDDIQEIFKKVPNQIYPIISKSINKTKQNFRKNLFLLINKLILSCNISLILYDNFFLNHLNTFLITMTSSLIKSIRHTSTFISLNCLLTSLCSISFNLTKELNNLISRIEKEKENHQTKKKNKNSKLIDWEERKLEVENQKKTIEVYINELFDGVFVHRYRDSDPNIRVECVKALGEWMITLPDYFIGGNYLRYIGWVLTDSHKEVRFEALKVLKNLYSKEDNIGLMQHFTNRFKFRLIEIGIGEPNFKLRIITLEVLTLIDKFSGLLLKNQRFDLLKLIYYQNFKIRNSIANFFNNYLNEFYDSRRIKLNFNINPNLISSNSINNNKFKLEEIEKWLKLKCLAKLLIKCGSQKVSNSNNDDNHEDEDHGTSSQSSEDEDEDLIESIDDSLTNMTLRITNFPEKGRVALAVESLWEEVKILQDWESMANYLLLDHSASNHQTKSSNIKNRRISVAMTQDESANIEGQDSGTVEVEDSCKLSEAEESLLIEVFVASLRKAASVLTNEELAKEKKKKRRINKRKKDLVTDDDEEENDESDDDLHDDRMTDDYMRTHKSEITRFMIKILPQLYSKYNTDSIRLSEVFRIPKLMYINLYLELRSVSAYEELWDVLTRQYLKQQAPQTIEVISSTIDYLINSTKSLSHINDPKIKVLDQKLIESLFKLIQTKRDLEVCTFEEDEIVSLNLILLKIVQLIRYRDLSYILEAIDSDAEDLIGLTKPIDLIHILANRGRLSYHEESKMIEFAMEILQLHFMWVCSSLCRLKVENKVEEGDDEGERASLGLKKEVERVIGFRDRLFVLLREYAIDPNCDACEEIKRTAFVHLLNAFMLCCGSMMPKELMMKCDEQTQYRCAGFVAAEIERFGMTIKKARARVDSEGSSEPEENDREKKRKLAKNVHSDSRTDEIPTLSMKELQAQEAFDILMTTYTKAICCGLIHFQHSNVILPHFTRFGPVFDLSLEALVGLLKGGLGNDPFQKELLAKTVWESMRESFELFINDETATEEQFIRLSKLLQSSIVIRGARLSVKAVLDSQAYIVLHTTCIEWLVKKASNLETDVEAESKWAVMFKGLMHLVPGLDGRAALKIKSIMDASLQTHGLEISETSKAWDPYRAYLKRLISIMAKDPSIKRAAKLALKKQNGTEPGVDDERRVSDDELMDGPQSDKEERVESTSRTLVVRAAQSSEMEETSSRPVSASREDEAVTSKLSAIAKGKARAIHPSDPPTSVHPTRRRSRLSSVVIPARPNSSSVSHSIQRGGPSLISVVIPTSKNIPKRKRTDSRSLLSSSSIGVNEEEQEDIEEDDDDDDDESNIKKNLKKRRKIIEFDKKKKKKKKKKVENKNEKVSKIDKKLIIKSQIENDDDNNNNNNSEHESEISLAEFKRRRKIR
ncbi:hypothetical protein CROQUDRAFT_82784 [Cronartium quercuum f. sp. fusiforme G11]|uniref:SCD domain-containing protein n=1 Tax=Cronartium quercuum f. sp. fusiforme G11 TaxID=708437 RepID=A0A9P6N9P4_9BASI|nr:hypothetical protein CROQUDRAFT_82784 [Cronartium quercuum f. sp. fusiforme G11]